MVFLQIFDVHEFHSFKFVTFVWLDLSCFRGPQMIFNQRLRSHDIVSTISVGNSELWQEKNNVSVTPSENRSDKNNRYIANLPVIPMSCWDWHEESLY